MTSIADNFEVKKYLFAKLRNLKILFPQKVLKCEKIYPHSLKVVQDLADFIHLSISADLSKLIVVIVVLF